MNIKIYQPTMRKAVILVGKNILKTGWKMDKEQQETTVEKALGN